MYLKLFAVVIFLFLGRVNADNAYNNCAEVGTQRHVAIDQLMGLWYGIELISHRPETSYEPQPPPDSCLQVNISEEPNLREDANRNYNRQNYDGRNNRYDNYDTITTTQNPYEMRRNQDRRRKNWGQYGRNDVYVINEVEQRKLKVLWKNADGSVVTYWTSYMSAPGVWHITGPHNGSSMIETLDNFSGTIQVLKAVGDHLVLTFCHIRPDQKLYTVILSRLPELKRRDILSIHNMLTNRGLDIVNVRNVCTISGASNLNVNIIVGLICYALLSLW